MSFIQPLFKLQKDQHFGPRHCLTKCALENKLLNQNCWSWYHFSQEKLPHKLIPFIASTYCGKYPVPFFLGHPVYIYIPYLPSLSDIISPRMQLHFLDIGSRFLPNNEFHHSPDTAAQNSNMLHCDFIRISQKQIKTAADCDHTSVSHCCPNFCFPKYLYFHIFGALSRSSYLCCNKRMRPKEKWPLP